RASRAASPGARIALARAEPEARLFGRWIDPDVVLVLRGAPALRRLRRRLAHDDADAVAEPREAGRRDPLAGREAARHLDQRALTEPGLDLAPAGGTVGLHAEDARHAGERHQRLDRHHERFGVRARQDLRLAEEAGLELTVAVRDEGLDGERATLHVRGGADARQAAVDRVVGVGLDVPPHLLSDLDLRGEALGDLPAQAEGVVGDDHEDRRARPHVVADVDQALRDPAVERRADPRVLDLDRKDVAARARDAGRARDRVELLGRHDLLVAQLLGALLVVLVLLERRLGLPQLRLELRALEGR